MMYPKGPERGSFEGRSALERLELALDRISGAVVRRLERDAVHHERAPLADADRTGEVRQRLDALILRLRNVLIESEGGPSR